jgi:hypothetical protein
MLPAERHKLILAEIRKIPGEQVDILNRYFVEWYVDATKSREKVKMFGANGCPRLASDLLAMKKAGMLTRCRIGVSGMAGMGFPKWVWSYRPHPLYVE